MTSEIIAQSKTKCTNCKRVVVSVVLLPTKQKVKIDKVPAPDGRVVVVEPGILGDKQRPCRVAYVSRSYSGAADRYRIHACSAQVAA